jgi:hypothetical protein
MISKDGIYYNLAISVYKQRIEGLTYYFSSKINARKFNERIENNRVEINLKMRARFHVDTDFKALADLLLYRSIEKRGFYIENDKGVALCQENLIYGGEIPILKSYELRPDVLTTK